MRTLFSRAEKLSSTLTERTTEEVHILEALERNGYPSHLVQRNQKGHVLPTVSMTSSPPSARVTIPYVQGQSEAIRRVLQGLNIQTSFAPATSLRRILSHPKDPVLSSNKSGVVYQIPVLIVTNHT